MLIDHNTNAQRLALPMPLPRSANDIYQLQRHVRADLTRLRRFRKQRHDEFDGGLVTAITADVPTALGAASNIIEIKIQQN
ncbi:hypothetical protein [uncultured Stenotrophomonas sp.]|uniref:hypothetical protein n=1 Tax=uncultured Stenotrophomonas sp. TaxID=165438 RepID=UPI0025DCCECF|nr:hypothetical protein [uncultured Stenotrophomonas sp.]